MRLPRVDLWPRWKVRLDAGASGPGAAGESLRGHLSRERCAWRRLGSGVSPIPTCELLEDPAYKVLLAGPYRVRASGPRIMENFLDVGHFPFVHEGVLGDRARPEIADYAAEITSSGVVATGVKVFQPDPYGTGHGSTASYTYRVHRPLSASFVKDGEHSFGMLLSVTPHDAVDSTAWMWMAMNYEHDRISGPNLRAGPADPRVATT